MNNYRVTVYDSDGYQIEYAMASTEPGARALAQEKCDLYAKDRQIYVEFYRISDQKNAYLNRNGLDVTGIDWNTKE